MQEGYTDLLTQAVQSTRAYFELSGLTIKTVALAQQTVCAVWKKVRLVSP